MITFYTKVNCLRSCCAGTWLLSGYIIFCVIVDKPLLLNIIFMTFYLFDFDDVRLQNQYSRKP